MTEPRQKLLFAASEAFPLVKTGGLADVAGSLPEVLRGKGLDVRLLLPAYADLMARLAEAPAPVAELELAGQAAQLLECRLPGTALRTWLLQHPLFSDRPGNPYHDGDGLPWADNADRFMLLSRAAASISLGSAGLDWQPDILHCNDWHAAPAIGLVHQATERPLTVFTIHSLAHMGIFDRATFERLALPGHFWHEDEMEFYGQCSFIKSALVHADWITTVSPGYAREICSSPGGMGLEGLLARRRERLVGIVNGIDDRLWDPGADLHLVQNYDLRSLPDKWVNKAALQEALGLESTRDRPLLGFVGRLVEQKGLELILPEIGRILDSPAQLVVLGTGEAQYESRLLDLAADHPGAMSVVMAYDEGLAHRIEAAADIFLMPSLFEPCGLNQLYSLRYGTLPVVRAVGGLADTVEDATAAALAAGSATGFIFREPDSGEFLEAVRRAIRLWSDPPAWRKVQETAMSRDFSWGQSADRYLALYRSAV